MGSLVPEAPYAFSVHWVSKAQLTKGWGFFFKQEICNLFVLFSLIFAWHHFIAGWCLPGVTVKVLGALALRRWIAGGLCSSTKSLEGKTVIITGASAGIGFETTREMLRRGAHVIMACRDPNTGQEAQRRLLGEGGRSEVRQLDLSSLASVRSFAEGVIKDGIKVHVLINNAGIMACPYMETKEGFELQMGTNLLGHFLLTNLLLPQLQHEQGARIINYSSLSHVRGKIDFDHFMYTRSNYDRMDAYSNSKLAIILFSRQLAKRLKGTNIQVFTLHPGTVMSRISRHYIPPCLNACVSPFVLKTTAEGAQTTAHCATEAAQHPYMYFCDCAPLKPIPEAMDDVAAEKLWRVSAQLVGLKE